ncbi:PepSY-associated TM helix domain-containing protein [Candidatus Riflebacteria bacterium]
MADRPFSFFHLNRILHRDIGYLCAGLTIIYCISGIAVNHVGDWNPNYQIKRYTETLKQLPPLDDKKWEEKIIKKLGLTAKYKDSFQPSPTQYRLFLENVTVDIDLETGKARIEKTMARPLLNDFNYLHLNHAKKAWTYMADIYALALLYLAVGGLFMLRGKNGIFGRGAWLTAIGMAIPIFFLVYLKYW